MDAYGRLPPVNDDPIPKTHSMLGVLQKKTIYRLDFGCAQAP